MARRAAIERVDVTVIVVPTETPESDGTFEWTSTTAVLVEIEAAGERGLGRGTSHPSFTAPASTVGLISSAH